MNEIELKFNRMNTVAFIAAKPVEIVLTPQDRVKTVGGFKYEDGTPRAPQTMRIIELGMNVTPPILTLSDGTQREAEFWLLGEWDADIAVNDHWLAEDGREWVVGDLVRTNHYEVRALVAERGR